MEPKDDPSDPAFYQVGQGGVEPAKPPEPPDLDVYSAQIKVNDPKPREITFSGGRGAAVLSENREPIALEGLQVGQRVFVPSLFGYYKAVVIEISRINSEALAETKGLYFPLWVHKGQWYCDSVISKEAASQLGKAKDWKP